MSRRREWYGSTPSRCDPRMNCTQPISLVHSDQLVSGALDITAAPALDVSVQAQVLNLLQDMKEQLGLTVLFISHDLAVVSNVSDRVAVMYLGKLCEIGDAVPIYEHAAHPYTAALLASVPDPDPGCAGRRPADLAGAAVADQPAEWMPVLDPVSVGRPHVLHHRTDDEAGRSRPLRGVPPSPRSQSPTAACRLSADAGQRGTACQCSAMPKPTRPSVSKRASPSFTNVTPSRRGIFVGQIVSTVPSTTIDVPALSVARSCTASCSSGFVGSYSVVIVTSSRSSVSPSRWIQPLPRNVPSAVRPHAPPSARSAPKFIENQFRKQPCSTAAGPAALAALPLGACHVRGPHDLSRTPKPSTSHLLVADADRAADPTGLLEVPLGAADGVVRLADRLERHVHLEVRRAVPSGGPILGGGEHHRGVDHVLCLAE